MSKEEKAEAFRRKQADLGIFRYADGRFLITSTEEVREFAWTDIETVFGFKRDRMTFDEICMDIFTEGKGNLRVSEETPGWYQFNEHFHENIPGISNDWYLEIIHPAFATNMTLLFDKQGRALQAAEAECYKA